MTTQAEKIAQQLIEVLRALGDGWHSRSEIAAYLQKSKLNPSETTALDLLASQGVIEGQLAQGSRPNVNQYLYRAKD
jgi:hypothetical protein